MDAHYCSTTTHQSTTTNTPTIRQSANMGLRFSTPSHCFTVLVLGTILQVSSILALVFEAKGVITSNRGLLRRTLAMDTSYTLRLLGTGIIAWSWHVWWTWNALVNKHNNQREIHVKPEIIAVEDFMSDPKCSRHAMIFVEGEGLRDCSTH